MKNLTLDELTGIVHECLRRNPEWLGETLKAVNSGTQAAILDLLKSRSRYDAAFRAALTLAKRDRLSSEVVATMNTTITRAIDQTNMCELEKRFIDDLP